MATVITGQPKPPRKGSKRGRPAKAPRGPRAEYRRALERLNVRLKEQTQLIAGLIADDATAGAVRDEIERQLAIAQAEYDAAAERLASNVVRRLSEDNRRKLEDVVKDALGVDTAKILDTPTIRDQLDAALHENVSLIKTIPQKHFADVAEAVYNNYRGVSFIEGSLRNRLMKIGSISDNRAQIIARDQTSKIVASLNKTRQSEIGIRRYIWRNQKDERVVGNPSGRYPKGSRLHRDHWSREGKIFRWDKAPPDGHPGEPILCRCYPEPVLDFDELRQNAIRL